MSYYSDEYDDNFMDTSSRSKFHVAINKTAKAGQHNCVICGVKASGVNFNVLTVSKK